MKSVQISRHRIRTFLQAEKVCQAVRTNITSPGEADWNHMNGLLVRWIQMAPKRVAYAKPPRR